MENNSDVRDSVQKYINALKVARTDSEKFAALLVIAQIEKNMKLTPQERKAVYGTIELTFIKRLLNAQKEPEGCEKGTLTSLGLTILSCMVNEVDGANENTKILDLVPRLIGLLYEVDGAKRSEEGKISEFDKEITENCFGVLKAIATSEIGCECVFQYWSFKSKTKLDRNNTVRMLELILACALKLKGNVLSTFKDTLKDLLSIASSHFALTQDEEKFTLLHLIFNFVNISVEKYVFEGESQGFDSALKNLRTGLQDIMQSKVDKKYRHLALKLVSNLVELFGLRWTFVAAPNQEEKKSNKFLHMMVSLTAVEIKMIFYEKNNDAALLSYLFSIIERTIEVISTNEDDIISDHLGKTLIFKIMQTINDVMSQLMHFLDEMKENFQPNDACKDVRIKACIRLLCAYMSEETQAVEKEVLKIAPYLVELGKASFLIDKDELHRYIDCKGQMSKPAIIFIFMLPVLCHWSADDATRKVMLEADLHGILWQFLEKIIILEEDTRHETIETLLGIFMNIAITEPTHASDPRSVFGPMLKQIMSSLEKFSSKPIQLLINLVTLGVILGRAQLHHEDANSKFFSQCLKCYFNACPYLRADGTAKYANWSLISELWFVGMDNLIACLSKSKKLNKAIKDGPTTLEVGQFLQTKEEKSEDAKMVYSLLENLSKVLSKG